MDNYTKEFIQLDDFGPARPGAFDFTLLFEDTIFAIAPAVLFLLAAGIRTAILYRSPAKVESTSTRQVKIAFLSGFVALELALLLLWTVTPGATTRASVPAACLDFIAACALLVLSSYEHTRSVAPSTLIGIYLLATLPLDIARVRSLFLLDKTLQTKSIGTVLAASITLKMAVLFSEAVNKRKILLAGYQHLPLEATSSPYSKSVFWWVNPLLWSGFSKMLEVGDLYTLDDSLSSTLLLEKFRGKWSSKSGHKYGLLRATFSVLRWSLLISALPRLLLIGTKFAQPFLLQRTIDYVSNREDQPANIGWGLVGAYALVYAALALLAASSTYLINRLRIRIRGGLVSLIYRKTVDLSITALEEKAALTLMSTDIERITTSFQYLHDAWAAFIEVGIALYLLYRQLGVGFIAPAICFICAALAMTICTRLFPRYQKIWVEAIQTRVAFTSTMLGSMRSIKLLGISSVVSDLAQRLRIGENVIARKYRWLIIFQVIFQNITSFVAPVTTFAVYVIRDNAAGKPLDTSTAFTVLSILQLLEPPLTLLVQSLPLLVASIGCFQRIQTFLLSSSRHDHRLLLQDKTGFSQSHEVRSLREEGIELVELSPSKLSTEDILVLNQCSFGWATDKPLLHNIEMSVKRGSLSMVIGPTGCGKSTLLKGILGETPSSSGFVYISTTSVSFADQDPWTINSTVKACICGESSYDEVLYEEVLDCCDLREDLKSFPKGDLTVVGSKGISLSGGQKQRLALARAVFAQKELLILDDVFSGLDADTEERIFRRLFGKTGPIRRNGITILLVTHAVSRLTYADWVVAISKEGRIEEQGTYLDLQRKGGYVANLAVRFKETATECDEKFAETTQMRPTAGGNSSEEDDLDDNLKARKTGDWTTYKHYFTAAGRFSISLAAFWAITYVLGIKAPGLLVKYFIGPSSTISSDRRFMIALGVAAVSSLFTIAVLVWQIFLDIIPRASNGLHGQLLNTVSRAPLSFFTKTDSGSILNRFSQDLTVIDSELPGAMIGAFLQLALFLTGGGLMAATASYFLATVPLVILALVAVQNFYLRTSRQLRHLELEAKAPLYTHFQETLSGLVSIRAFGWIEQFCAKSIDLLDKSQRPYYLLLCIQCWLAVVMDLMVTALATILMAIVVSLRHKINPGLVGLGLLNVMSFNDSLSAVVKLWTLTETSIGAIARVRHFINHTESEAKDIEKARPSSDWPSTGTIEIRNFAASYNSSSDLVLKGVDLIIRPGEKLGICGRSGSGKSSMLASILHLLEFREGSITIDGQDLATVPRDLLRQRLNAIPQEPFWVSTETVRFNLNPWSDTQRDDAVLINTLKRCQIWDVIEQKGGLDMKMTSDSLSHGQRQLFCLARSLLRKSKIVILDEVSSR